MDEDTTILHFDEPKHLFQKVLDFQEAIHWIAHGNFAGSSLGPRALFEFSKASERFDRIFHEDHGREQLAFDLICDRAEVGEIRLFGRRSILISGNDLGTEPAYWGDAAEMPEPIAPEIVQTASWTDDDGGRLDADSVSYSSLTVHFDDLMKCFPSRGQGAPARGADVIRNRFYEATTATPSQSTRSIASIETKCRLWIAELAAQDVIPRSRDDLFSQALQKFADGLSRRGFDRCWDQAAPESWKRAGRKPRQE